MVSSSKIKAFILSLCLIFAPLPAQATFYKDPQGVFVVEYPEGWGEQESRFNDAFVIASQSGEGIDRCSFRKETIPVVKGKNNEQILKLLQRHGQSIWKEIHSGIPKAEYISETIGQSSTYHPIHFLAYQYSINYRGEDVAMAAILVTAFNTWTGHSIHIGCSTSLERFPNKITTEFMDIAQSVMALPP